MVHVDELLDSMTPREFTERWAESILDGWGTDSQRFAMLATLIRNSILEAIAGYGLRKVDQSEFCTEETFLPSVLREEEAKPKWMTAVEAEAAAQARYG